MDQLKKMKNNPRREFRTTEVEGEVFLYPWPVVKDKKYLIRIPKGSAEIFQSAIEREYLDSPDIQPNYLMKSGLHGDGQTIIYKINTEKLNFEFFDLGVEHEIKGTTIQRLLSSKILACLKNLESNQLKDEDASVQTEYFNTVYRTFEKQKKCRTCQEIGILNKDLEAFFELFKK